MGLWGRGGEELAWEDRMGGSQARQSMKQLTGAGKGVRGEEVSLGGGLGYLRMPLSHARGLRGRRGWVRGLWLKS